MEITVSEAIEVVETIRRQPICLFQMPWNMKILPGA